MIGQFISIPASQGVEITSTLILKGRDKYRRSEWRWKDRRLHVARLRQVVDRESLDWERFRAASLDWRMRLRRPDQYRRSEWRWKDRRLHVARLGQVVDRESLDWE